MERVLEAVPGLRGVGVADPAAGSTSDVKRWSTSAPGERDSKILSTSDIQSCL